ncbi:Fe-only nitrogenase subunit delta [Brooklawnia cerclae]|uniref:Nitrogenase iron-iron protein delta chain n=1 Tax=Brooklawnia cerclae TaxID=349934 RepID=A0ABX0SHD4_9ACTN|nr:Fe-only nitrogenase subunit delta [Brooklawnia cerclae]NIH57813.1 nitrogenase delta subunit [Brooklawnia cerclae]
MTEEKQSEYMELLLDHIMKKCLWQFHSRAWDRERQNEHILGMTCDLLCGEEIVPSTPEDKCYYADALDLSRAYRNKFGWLDDLSAQEIRQVMQALREKLDYLTITGSLNEELTDTHY